MRVNARIARVPCTVEVLAAADTPSDGTHWLSPETTSSFLPSTPPAALISLAARLAPLIGLIRPIL
jgi:hypothetical protein